MNDSVIAGSFWSAYRSEKSVIDWSNSSLFQIGGKATASPERACARASVQPQIRRRARARPVHRLDNRRALHVAQLAPVEMAVGLLTLGPPK